MIAFRSEEMLAPMVEVSNYVSWPELSKSEEKGLQDKYKALQIDRKCLNDGFLLKKFDRSVRFEVARLEDHSLIHEFLLQEFGKQEPLNKSLGITNEDLEDPINNLLTKILPQQTSILVIDQGYLCGVIINAVSNVNRNLIKEPKIQDNYGSETNNGVSPKLRLIYAILDEMEAITPKFLPIDCSEYLRIDIISVRPEYAGCGLGKRLMTESLKLAHLNGIKFCEATCTAISSTKICQSLGMESKFEFPYKTYKYLGQLVFPTKMHDGGQAANLMIGDLSEITKGL